VKKIEAINLRYRNRLCWMMRFFLPRKVELCYRHRGTLCIAEVRPGFHNKFPVHGRFISIISPINRLFFHIEPVIRKV
jgi:hypothetical protein